jgi:nitrilase
LVLSHGTPREGGRRDRYALIADGEQIHSAMFPGSIFDDLFSQQTEIQVRNHALESGVFVVAATAWLDTDQRQQIVADTGCPVGSISGGCFTAIITPQGELLGDPLRSGEGAVIGDLDFGLIDKRKAFMDSSGHDSRPELLSLLVDHTPTAHVHSRFPPRRPWPTARQTRHINHPHRRAETPYGSRIAAMRKTRRWKGGA